MKSEGMGNLVLVRHGESEWNKKNLFTGWKNPGLSERGIKEAEDAGKALKNKGYSFDCMFTSNLKRAQKTGQLILKYIHQTNLKVIKNEALNERNYGDLAGLNKDEARKRWGDKQVHLWRRSYDTRPPGGESLKDTANRVLPYFVKNIDPLLRIRKNILVTAHGNSLRALVMHLEKLDKAEIVKLEIKTGIPISYEFDKAGKVSHKLLIFLK
tara:strand:+ start:3736 stop:4371 length:636 start_codon:yes stop_codon:yes gene_type:complete